MLFEVDTDLYVDTTKVSTVSRANQKVKWTHDGNNFTEVNYGNAIIAQQILADYLVFSSSVAAGLNNHLINITDELTRIADATEANTAELQNLVAEVNTQTAALVVAIDNQTAVMSAAVAALEAAMLLQTVEVERIASAAEALGVTLDSVADDIEAIATVITGLTGEAVFRFALANGLVSNSEAWEQISGRGTHNTSTAEQRLYDLVERLRSGFPSA